MNAAVWRDPPATLVAQRHEVHVWRVALDAPEPEQPLYESVLSPDERSRAARFHFVRDRRRFTVARGALRQVLSRYTGLPAHDLHFCYNAYGKPALTPACGGATVRFNLSHADALALIAVTAEHDIGVDIEQIRTEISYEQIARQFFSPQEVIALRSLPNEVRPQGFFNCWTRKEAYIKAQGVGLSLPMHSFDVSLAPGQAAALLHTCDDPAEAARWTLTALDPGAGYVGAVAVAAHGWQLRCWDWPPCRAMSLPPDPAPRATQV